MPDSSSHSGRHTGTGCRSDNSKALLRNHSCFNVLTRCRSVHQSLLGCFRLSLNTITVHILHAIMRSTKYTAHLFSACSGLTSCSGSALLQFISDPNYYLPCKTIGLHNFLPYLSKRACCICAIGICSIGISQICPNGICPTGPCELSCCKTTLNTTSYFRRIRTR